MLAKSLVTVPLTVPLAAAAVAIAATLAVSPIATGPAFAGAVRPAGASPVAAAWDPRVESVDVFRNNGTGPLEAQIVLSGVGPRAVGTVVADDDPASVEGPFDSSDSGRMVLFASPTPGVANHLTITVEEGFGSRTAIFHVVADDSGSGYGAPEVGVVEHPETGRADVTVTGRAGAVASVFGPTGRIIAIGRLDRDSRTFDIPLPPRRAAYSANVYHAGDQSPHTGFELSGVDLEAAPGAPRAEVTGVSGGRAVVSVSGEPGAIGVATDASGRVVAVKLLPTAGGEAAIALPTAATAREIDVAVRRDGKTSAGTPVELPAAR